MPLYLRDILGNIEMELKHKRELIFAVDGHDLDQEISKFLKSKKARITQFEIGPYEETSNYTDKEYIIDSKWAYTDGREEIKQIMEGKLHYQTANIMTWMCIEGIIEPGKYIIDVSW